MPYKAEISRANPGCILFLVDQSGSMADSFAGSSHKSKAEAVAVVLNRLLLNVVIKCTKNEGVRDYFYIGVLGYGGRIGPVFSGQLAGQELVPVSQIANSPLRIEEVRKKVEDGAGGLVDIVVKMPVWIEPLASGETPMCEILSRTKYILEKWITKYPHSYPPIVINITDGEATDGNPLPIAEEIKSLSTSDGNVLLFNIHLSSIKAYPIEFPDNEEYLPDVFAKLLFRMSSILPKPIREAARQEGYNVTDNSRGFVFNADMVSLIRFLDIGTRPATSGLPVSQEGGDFPRRER